LSGDYSGPRKAKPPFPINLLFNQKAFYLFFIILMIASMAAVGLGPGFGSSSGNNPVPIVEEQSTAEATAINLKTWPDGPAPTIDGTKPYIARLETNKGEIQIQLATDAPATVNSFAFLAGTGFYNGTILFYVNHDYFAQGGDPTCEPDSPNQCSGVGSPGYTLPVEKTQQGHEQWAVVAPYLSEGQVAHGSQFRILFQPDLRSDGKETVFGKIVDPQSQQILESLSAFQPCNIVEGSQSCDVDTSSALVINNVTVEPA